MGRRTHRSRALSLLLVLSVLVLQACSFGSKRADDTSVSSSGSSVTTASTGTQPEPLAAWSLQGNGEPSVGDVGLGFAGGYSLTPRGAAFDGTTGEAVTQGPGPLDTTRSLTLSAWVSYADQLTDVPMAVAQVGEQNLSVGLGIAGAQWIFGTSDRDLPGLEAGGATIAGPKAVRSNDWVHLVGVSDREAGVIRFYIDGRSVGDTSASEPFAASGPLVIGGGGPDQTNGWGGAVSDVRVYQVALSAEQVAELYRTTRPSGPPPKWRLDPAMYANGILDGTWDFVVDEKQKQLKDALESEYGKSIGQARIRLGFDGQGFWEAPVIDGRLWRVDGYPEGDRGIVRIDGDQLTITGGLAVTTYRWHLDGDQLRLRFVKECSTPAGGCRTRAEVKAGNPMVLLVMEHAFTRSGDHANY
jgi:hypothetical protein